MEEGHINADHISLKFLSYLGMNKSLGRAGIEIGMKNQLKGQVSWQLEFSVSSLSTKIFQKDKFSYVLILGHMPH